MIEQGRFARKLELFDPSEVFAFITQVFRLQANTKRNKISVHTVSLQGFTSDCHPEEM